ncbi:MAG: helix-turn-helix transcriptional regulator [Bacteroidia bacterium]|nr:helix-turn-helix transcriptional regulator [Bacteroidia bacterium]
MTHIGRKIRIVRQLKGYSQEYMAMRLGVSQNAYSKMERGRIGLKNARVIAISNILEIPTYNLLKVNESRYMAAEEAADYRSEK